MEKKIVKYQTTKAAKQNNRVLRFIGSDEKVDRDGDRVMIDGWDLKEYKKNPVVLFAHNRSDVPVARTKKVWIDNKQLKFDIEFPDSDISSVGDSLYKLYESGYMKATSVGFLPDYNKVTYPEKQMKDGTTRIINGQKLLEISLVSVGSNQRALLTSKSMEEAIEKEVIDQLELDELLVYFKDNQEIDEKDTTENEDIKINITEDKVIELEAKIVELELQLFDKQIEDKEDNIYSELYKEYITDPELEEEIFMNEIIDTLKE